MSLSKFLTTLSFNPIVNEHRTLLAHQQEVQKWLRRPVVNLSQSSHSRLEFDAITESTHSESGKILALEMGCGKTVCTLFQLKELHLAKQRLYEHQSVNRNSNYLVVAPTSVIKQWYYDELPHLFCKEDAFLLTSQTKQSDWYRFVIESIKSPTRLHGSVKFVITSYDVLSKHYHHLPSELKVSQDGKLSKKSRRILKPHPQLTLHWNPTTQCISQQDVYQSSNLYSIFYSSIVVDEAHYIKNAIAVKSGKCRFQDVSRCRAVLLLRLVSEVHKYALTGTPASNALSDTGSLHLFTLPRPKNAIQSQQISDLLTVQQLKHWQEQDFQVGAAWARMIQSANNHSLDILKVFLENYMIVQSLKEVLPDILPPIHRHEEILPNLASEQAFQVTKLIHEGEQLVDQFYSGERSNSLAGEILAYILRMRQIFSHPILIAKGLNDESSASHNVNNVNNAKNNRKNTRGVKRHAPSNLQIDDNIDNPHKCQKGNLALLLQSLDDDDDDNTSDSDVVLIDNKSTENESEPDWHSGDENTMEDLLNHISTNKKSRQDHNEDSNSNSGDSSTTNSMNHRDEGDSSNRNHIHNPHQQHQQQVYDGADEWLEYDDGRNVTQILDASLHMNKEQQLKQVEQLMNQSTRLAKVVELALKYLKEDPTEGLLIFTSFVGMGRLIQHCVNVLAPSRLGQTLAAQFMHGQLNIEERDVIIQQFKTSTAPNHPNRVLICTIRTGNVGLNLMRATRVFIVEPDYNPTVEQQAEMRAYRIGQNKPVHIHRFLVKGRYSIDEWLRQLQHEKIESVIKLIVKYIDTSVFKPISSHKGKMTVKGIILFISNLLRSGAQQIEKALLNGNDKEDSNCALPFSSIAMNNNNNNSSSSCNSSSFPAQRLSNVFDRPGYSMVQNHTSTRLSHNDVRQKRVEFLSKVAKSTKPLVPPLLVLDQTQLLNFRGSNGKLVLHKYINNNYYLAKSDVDSQMLLTVPFSESVSLDSVRLTVSTRRDNLAAQPKTIKIFLNQAGLNLTDVQVMAAAHRFILPPVNTLTSNQEITKLPISPQQKTDQQVTIVLKLPSTPVFRKVEMVSVFVQDNFGADFTALHYCEFYGGKI